MRTAGLAVATLAAALLAGACSREPEGLQIATGTDVALEKNDGVTVSGRLVEVRPQEVVLEANGQKTMVPRADIKALRVSTGTSTSGQARTPAPEPPVAPAPPVEPPAPSPESGTRNATPAEPPRVTPPPPATAVPAYRQVTLPAGTVLPVELRTAIGSETSRVEDQVRGTLRKPVTVDGVEVLPAGTAVLGTVTQAERSGRVKGLARVAFRFSQLDLPGDPERISIRTAAIAREAAPTKKQDAAKIGGGAAAGAVIGGIIGGGDGAAKGAAIGGGAGTGVVLSTRGKEVSLPAGTSVSARLTEPVSIRVRVR